MSKFDIKKKNKYVVASWMASRVAPLMVRGLSHWCVFPTPGWPLANPHLAIRPVVHHGHRPGHALRPSPLPPHVPQFAPPLCHCWPDRTLPSHQCHNAPSSALPHPLPPPARYAMANPPSFPSSPIHCPEAAARLPQSTASLLSFIPTILATTVPSRGGVCYRIFF